MLSQHLASVNRFFVFLKAKIRSFLKINIKQAKFVHFLEKVCIKTDDKAKKI
jgi:hypothetical protein